MPKLKSVKKSRKRSELMNVPQEDRHLASRKDVQSILTRIRRGMPMTLVSVSKLENLLLQAYIAGTAVGSRRKYVEFKKNPTCRRLIKELKG